MKPEHIKLLSDKDWRLNNLYWITDKEGKPTWFRMMPEQREYFEGIHTRNIILKARQLGFTTEVCIIQLDAALFESAKCALIAHTLNDAKRLFREKVKYAYDKLPVEIKAANPARNDSSGELVFKKGGSIYVSTSFRGGTLRYLHVSEFGKICAKYPDKAREIVTGAFEAVSTGCFATIESTAEGRAGYFFDYCQTAEKALLQGKPLSALDWKFFFFSWWKNPQYAIDPVESLPVRLLEYFAEMEAKHGVVVNERQKAWYYSKEKTLDDDMKREYPERLDFDHFYNMYERNGAAFGAVHKLLDACWTDTPVIVDGDETKKSKKSTPWEKKVTKLMKKHWAKVKDADRRNLVGHYSALILQFADSKEWWEPVDRSVMRNTRERGLVKMIPAWEAQVKPGELEQDQKSPDYGMPKFYYFQEQQVGDNGNIAGPMRSIKIHPERIIMFCEGSEDETSLAGIPFLRAGYNDLLDMAKTSGGSAEGFLKNASRQLGINMSKDTNLNTIVDEAKKAGYSGLAEALNAAIQKLNSGTDSALVTQDGEAKVLSVAAADPSPTWTVSANQFSSSVQIPFTIIFGQQTGRLASDQDKNDFAKRCNGRRGGFQTGRVTAVIERLWTVEVIEPPKSGEITLTWSDLLAPSEKEKIANMKEMAAVAKDTQQAYGTPAIDENEVREAGELEPREDVKPPDPNKKVTTDDPLSDDTGAKDESRDTGSSAQQG